MDSFELNKIAGAVLGAGLMIMVIAEIGNLIVHPTFPETAAIAIDVPEEGTAEAAPAQAAPTPLPVLLASADAEAGSKAARKCVACHTFEQGGANKVGPNLWGVVMNEPGSHDGFSYSSALTELPEPWSYANLDAYLTKPNAFAPGNKMAFAGISNPKERADLLAYMRQMDPEQPAFPEPTPEMLQEGKADGAAAPAGGTQQAAQADGQQAAAPSQTAAAAGGGLAALLANADPAAGEKAVRVCKVCHSFEQGGPNKVGPNLWGVIGSRPSDVEGFSFSNAMQAVTEPWTYERLDAYLADPKGFIPGNKMAFAGVKKPEQRADMLAYMRQMHPEPPPFPQ